MRTEKVVYRVHAIERMFLRRISEEDVRHVLASGKMIEDYPDDTLYPSRLLLDWREARPLHVVATINQAEKEAIIITVYEPDPDLWDADFTRRTS